LIPTLLFTSTVLLLVDNFTYTVFRFGIVSTTGVWRGIYAFLLIILAIFLYTRIADLGNLFTIFFSRQKTRIRVIVPTMVILLAALGAIAPANISREDPQRPNSARQLAATRCRIFS